VKTGVMMMKIQLSHQRNKLHFKYIQIVILFHNITVLLSFTPTEMQLW